MSEERKNMIKEDGALHAVIPKEKATWFDFLKLTRATNSIEGGWNSKTYWGDAFDQLLDNPEILKIWTRNSLTLNSKSSPKPRTENFKMNRNSSEAHLKASNRFLSVSSDGENTLIRALYEISKTRDFKDRIKLIGYEIPLSSEGLGQLKVDLFGYSCQNDKLQLEIVELKKAKNTGDSPLFALVEAVCYAIQSIRCWENLKKELEKVSDFPSELLSADPPPFGLTVAAPKEYWDYWENDRDLKDLISTISEELTKTNCNLSYIKEELKKSDYADSELPDNK